MIQVWQRRGLVWDTALADLRNRYAGSAMGMFWNVVTPLLMLGLYTFIFTRIYSIRPGSNGLPPGTSFALYLASGFLPWGAFVETVTRGTNALLMNSAYLKRMGIREEVFIAQSALSGSLGMFIVLGLLLLAAPLLGTWPSLTWLFLPLVATLWEIFGFGLSLLLSALNVFFRDVTHLLVFFFQVWMWSLPVVYLDSLVPAFYRPWLAVNPAYPFLAVLRLLYFGEGWGEPWMWAAMVAWSVGATLLGCWVLRCLRAEVRDAL